MSLSQLPRTLTQATHDLDVLRIALYFAKLSASRSEEVYAQRVQRWVDASCPGVDLTHPQIAYVINEGRRGMRRRRNRRVKRIEGEVGGLVEMVERLKGELREGEGGGRGKGIGGGMKYT